MYLYAGKLPGSPQGLVFSSPTSQSKAFIHPNRFRLPAGMVDHSNPIVIAQDFGTCTVHELGIQRTCLSFNSGDGEALARHKGSVHVRLPYYSLASHDSTGRASLKLGIPHHLRLRVERYPRTSLLPVDYMGLYRTALISRQLCRRLIFAF